MNRRIIVVMLAAVAALAASAFAQRGEEHEEGLFENPEYQMDLRYQELELQAREAELDFQRQIQELELQERRAEIERRVGQAHKGNKGGETFMFLLIVVNILLTVWVYRDLQKRDTGSGLWIAITLLTGLLGALVYALVRLGDMRHGESSTKKAK